MKSRFTGTILQFYMNLLNEKESLHITALVLAVELVITNFAHQMVPSVRNLNLTKKRNIFSKVWQKCSTFSSSFLSPSSFSSFCLNVATRSL